MKITSLGACSKCYLIMVRDIFTGVGRTALESKRGKSNFFMSHRRALYRFLEISPSAFPRTLYKTTRLEKIHRHGVRSKFVVRPEFVVEVSSC